MAQKRRSRFRREYLNDFQGSKAEGFRYEGPVYRFIGTPQEQKRHLVFLGAFAALAALFTAVPECLPPCEMSNSFVTILPWLAQLITVFVLVWAVVRLILRARELREYVYEATVPRIRVCALLAAVFAGATLAAQVVFLLVRPPAEWGAEVWLRPVFSLLNTALCIGFRCAVQKSRWQTRASETVNFRETGKI